MKRSETNTALKELEAMVQAYKFALLPVCHFTPDQNRVPERMLSL